MEKEGYKWSAIIIGIIIGVLMVMIAVGFTIGILSDNPDGLERALIDAHSEKWVENLPSPWTPILGWIGNAYIEGIVGIILSAVTIMVIFYIPFYIKKRKTKD